MAIYALSDLHLPFSADKPMEIFGPAWDNYTTRLRDNWQRVVSPEDTVLIAGDLSWATYITHAHDDFKFVHELNGQKIISKGNHDYWWETVSKLNQYIEEQGFDSIRFLHNNCFVAENTVICGAKGYFSPDDGFTDEDRKFYNREIGRLELSLQQAQKTGCANCIAMLHYPPAPGSGFARLLEHYGANVCVYGHLHGNATRMAFNGVCAGVHYQLTSADYLAFTPTLIQQ